MDHVRSSPGRSRRVVALAALTVLGLAATALTAGTTRAATSSETISGAGRATATAERLDPPEAAVRPQVFLAYHGSEQLLGATDHQWPYVRRHLDGLWGNPFTPDPDPWASLDRAIELTSKVETRRLIVEHPIALGGGGCQGFGDDWYQEMVEHLSEGAIRYDRVGMALYAGENPDCWGANGGIAAADAHYRGEGYPSVLTLYQPQNLSSSVYSSSFPTIAPGSSGDVAYRSSDGVVLECPIDACLDPTFGAPFFDAIQAAHARNVPFIWFTGYHTAYGIGRTGWLEKIQSVYSAVAAFGLWRADDAIAIINYHGWYPALPERRADGSPADTVTGILAWLLEQRPLER